MHASLVPPLVEIGGEPDTVGDGGRAYVDMAEMIDQLADQLRGAVEAEYAIGKAADQFKEDAEQVADDIADVAPRYDGTGSALEIYADEFDAQKKRSDTAIEAIRETQQRLWPLYDDEREAEQAEALARSEHDEGSAEHLAAEQALQDIRTTIADLESNLDTLFADYADAGDAHDEAARAAADAIDQILGELNDSWWDRVADFFSTIGDFLLDALEQVLQWVSDIIIVVLAIVAIALVVLIGVLVLPWDQIDINNLIDHGIALGMGILGALHWILVPVLHIEHLRETPKMNLAEVVPNETDPASRYRDAFGDLGDVDSAGGSDKTVVDVIKVGVDENGDPIWRVVPPSTKDWEFAPDSGAANDLGSNLSLMLTPEQQAAYERMVYDAMEQAGVGPDDSVMMTGFSQGGILAGRMAEDSPYNIEAILVGGAPIDAMDIPDHVSVISIQHQGDPVHRLDGADSAPMDDNKVTVHVNPWDPEAQDEAPHSELDAGRHDAGMYGDTVQAIIDGQHGETTKEQRETIQQIIADQDKFFSDDETRFRYEGSE